MLQLHRCHMSELYNQSSELNPASDKERMKRHTDINMKMLKNFVLCLYQYFFLRVMVRNAWSSYSGTHLNSQNRGMEGQRQVDL